MITYEYFEKIMKVIIDDYQMHEDLDRYLYKYGIDIANMPSLGCVAIELLEKLVGAQDEEISWWIFDTNCGTDERCNFYTIDGEVIPVRTIKELWNLIMDNKE